MPLVDPLPYTPWCDRGSVVNGQFRWRLGARPLDLADWIQFGPDADGPAGWIAQKPPILAAHHAQVVAAAEGTEPECQEVADAVVEYLAAHAPDRPRSLDTSVHPIEAASKLVPDDLVVMVERDGRLVFGAGSVCFPNRWDLPSKIGSTMAEVHAPVARLNEQLDTSVDRFLDRLEPVRPFWRLGWGVIDVADGYTPPRPRHEVDGEVGSRGERTLSNCYVRVERETLRRLPGTRCVLFTIRTYIASMSSVMSDPVSFAALASAVAAMPDDIAHYKDVQALT